MKKLKLYFTQNSDISASFYASKRKQGLIESLMLLVESLAAPFFLVKTLLILPTGVNKILHMLESKHPVLVAPLLYILGIIISVLGTTYGFIKAPLHLISSVFNLTLFAMHKFFSLFEAERKTTYTPVVSKPAAASELAAKAPTSSDNELLPAAASELAAKAPTSSDNELLTDMSPEEKELMELLNKHHDTPLVKFREELQTWIRNATYKEQEESLSKILNENRGASQEKLAILLKSWEKECKEKHERRTLL